MIWPPPGDTLVGRMICAVDLLAQALRESRRGLHLYAECCLAEAKKLISP